MTFKTSVLAAVFASLALTNLQGQTQTPTHEDVVRLTYAKLMFANQVGLIEKAIPFGKKQANPAVANILQQNQLTITLSGFQQGVIAGNTAPLSTISTDFTAKPILHLTPEFNDFKTNGNIDSSEVAMAISWGTGENDGGGQAKIADVAADNETNWTQYLTYKVSATYQNKHVTYQAAFFFDDTGKAEAHDPFMIGLGSMISASVYPEVLLKHSNQNPTVRAWTKAMSTAPANAPAGQLSCDLATLTCSLPQTTLDTR